MPARNRTGLSENTRERIKTTMIVKRLVDHIDGKIDLKQTQIRAAEILLRKVLPDVQAISHDVTGTITHAAELTDGALLAYLNQQRALAADISDAEIIQDTPKPALIDAKPADSIPAEPQQCASEPVQAPSRPDRTPTDTDAAPRVRKRRTRAHSAIPKVEL